MVNFKKHARAGIILGIIGFVACLCLFLFYAILVAFVPSVAFIPLIPIALITIPGFIISVIAINKTDNNKTPIAGTILNSVCIVIIIVGLVIQQVAYNY